MAALFLVLAHVNPVIVLEDHVDLVEVNRFYDPCGKLILEQVIFWDWVGYDSHYRVVAWRMTKDGPKYVNKMFMWHDGNTLRKVISQQIRRTWTQHDPEIADREFVPQCRRRGLSRTVKVKSDE